MTGGLNTLTQADFSGGMFQGPDVSRIPANGSYDIINGLVDTDEGVIYRRGGAKYLTTTDVDATIENVWSGYLLGGRRTLFATPFNGWALADNATVPVQVSATGGPRRMASVGGLVAMSRGANADSINLYGGTLRGASYATGTATFTNGSAVVTGSGTSWLVNADIGQAVRIGTTLVGFIQSVDSNTQVKLQRPFTGSTVSGSAYSFDGLGLLSLPALGKHYEKYVATLANRLIVAAGSKLLFGGRYPAENVLTFNATDYHEVPAGATIIGLQPVRDQLLVFTTAGTYTITGMALDLTDAQGNPQQRLDVLNPNLNLWHDNGLSSYQGAAIVPATDDIYLMDAISSPRSIGRPIRKLYRSYVAANYIPGVAAIFNGHYFLPILKPTSPVVWSNWQWQDTLVCNLATGAWTRLAGYGGASFAYSARGPLEAYSDPLGDGIPAQPPALIGASGQRLLDLSGIFSPTAANKNDPDGSTHTFSLTTRDFTVAPRKAMVKKIRLWAEGVDAGSDNPTISAGYGEGPAGSSFVAMSGTAGPSDGETPAGKWDVNRADKHIRFRFTSSSPWASLKIKSLDVFVRPRGRV